MDNYKGKIQGATFITITNGSDIIQAWVCSLKKTRFYVSFAHNGQYMGMNFKWNGKSVDKQHRDFWVISHKYQEMV